tara:strand:- start:113 stop:1255 length:1143 start_codon:yes stop_codon:yes gene_type:complete
MNPKITDISQEDNYLKFRLSGTNVSIANALRRFILSEIPTIVFRTSPYEKNLVNIEINTTRMNNELIKQRLSCIPIHITDTDFPVKDYIIELDVLNDTDSTMYATTKDFKIKNVKNDKYLSTSDVNKIFPPDSITDDYIEIVRLRPKISDIITGEHIKFTAVLDIGIAKEDSAFNVVSTCSYGASTDKLKINNEWNNIVKDLKSKGFKKDSISDYKKDWLLLDAKRIIEKDSFNFTIESVGPFSEMSIIYKACYGMINKIKNFSNNIQSDESIIELSDNTIQNSYDITLIDEDYTLGKVLEYILYEKYYIIDTTKVEENASNKYLTYCGFAKPHPHINKSLIRLAFLNEKEKIDIITLLVDVCNTAIIIFEKISNDFIKD